LVKREGNPIKLESKFQHELITDIKHMFPDCIVLKNDPNYLQGVPDLTVFWRNKWATLEVKKSEKAIHQPNQDYYVNAMNYMSFSRFVYPENKEVVLHELQQSFRS
jgi:hypothetical protein